MLWMQTHAERKSFRKTETTIFTVAACLPLFSFFTKQRAPRERVPPAACFKQSMQYPGVTVVINFQKL
jgi:hypothetical protein